MQNRTLYGLIYLAAFMSLGHHIDHAIRGNQVGWPLTAEVNAFTYSLGIYPLILLGLYLYASGRVGPGHWALLSGSGALFVAAIHFGPTAIEPPADIINMYESRIVGWLAFAWLLAFVALLAATSLYEGYSWSRRRRARTSSAPSARTATKPSSTTLPRWSRWWPTARATREPGQREGILKRRE
jgi:hypothetical protein